MIVAPADEVQGSTRESRLTETFFRKHVGGPGTMQIPFPRVRERGNLPAIFTLKFVHVLPI